MPPDGNTLYNRNPFWVGTSVTYRMRPHRVLDGYTGVSHWGGVDRSVRGRRGRLSSIVFFRRSGSVAERRWQYPPIRWHVSAGGKRYDLAAEAVWEAYMRTLRGQDRVERFVWRYIGLAWFVLGAAVGSIANVVVQGFFG